MRCMMALIAGVALTLPVWAQQYPTKPIRLIVGFPPGGSNDIVARIVAPRLGELLGTQVVVENRAGANATIAADLVAKSAPDGYTVMLGSTSSLVISPHTYAKLPYDTLRDFAPVTTVAMTPEAVAVHPALPVKDLKSLVALAKSNPGKLDFASSGSGGLPHLAIELLKTQANINLQHVPFKGAGPAVTDLMGGHVQGMIMDFPAIYSQMQSGKLRGIALAAEKRISLMPDLPTSGEQGMPGLLAVNWFAVVAPAKTPAAIITRLHTSLLKTISGADVKEKLAAVGVETFTQNSPEAFAAYLKDDLARWGKVAKASGARAD
ncbi:MAG TPA: tripartite tricarboxylate transporter substrate binding protein [Burkholderiales bacterium]|nr:tripartite tricarboxylate transporter substrate binding protein [Burkholderiales bacterium]